MLSDKQQGVLRGMLAAVAITLVVLALAIAAPPQAFIHAFPGSLAQALKWDTLVVACLMLCIGLLARHRFFTPEDIDGGGLTSGTAKAHVLQSGLQNTLEQAVLAISAHVAWAASMPASWQAAVPAAAVLFVLGRVLFLRGYAHGAAARAIGFALTFYPSVAMLLAILGRLAWSVAPHA